MLPACRAALAVVAAGVVQGAGRSSPRLRAAPDPNLGYDQVAPVGSPATWAPTGSARTAVMAVLALIPSRPGPRAGGVDRGLVAADAAVGAIRLDLPSARLPGAGFFLWSRGAFVIARSRSTAWPPAPAGPGRHCAGWYRSRSPR